MINKDFGKTLTKRNVLTSVILFCLHFAIFVGLVALCLWLRDKLLDGKTQAMQTSNYLYALFCGLLLFVITYFYFYFERPALLASAKMIALVFTILDVYLVLSSFIAYRFSVYARPVALVALLVFVLVGRKDAIVMNIMCAADYVIIPVEASPWGLFGLANMFDFIDKVRSIAPRLEVLGIAITKADERKSYFKQTLETLREFEAARLFETYIRVDATVEWAQDNSQPVVTYKKYSRSAVEYTMLAKEIMKYADR